MYNSRHSDGVLFTGGIIGERRRSARAGALRCANKHGPFELRRVGKLTPNRQAFTYGGVAYELGGGGGRGDMCGKTHIRKTHRYTWRSGELGNWGKGERFKGERQQNECCGGVGGRRGLMDSVYKPVC